MTAYLKAIVAALASAVATLVTECSDGHVTAVRALVAAGVLLASFAAVYFAPNTPSPAADVAAPILPLPVVVPGPVTTDSVRSALADLTTRAAYAQHELDSFTAALASALPAPAPVAVPVAPDVIPAPTAADVQPPPPAV